MSYLLITALPYLAILSPVTTLLALLLFKTAGKRELLGKIFAFTVFPIITITSIIASMNPARISDQTFTVEVLAVSPWFFAAQRALNVYCIGISLAVILSNFESLQDRVIRVLASVFLFYVISYYIAPGLFGSKHEIDYRWSYMALVILASIVQVGVSDRLWSNLVIYSVFCVIIMSLIVTYFNSSMTIQRDYTSEILPIFNFRFWGVGSHPNAFGPACVIAFFIILARPMRRDWKLLLLVVLVSFIVLIQSKTATLALLGVGLFKMLRWPFKKPIAKDSTAVTDRGDVRVVISLATISIALVVVGATLMIVGPDRLFEKLLTGADVNSLETMTGRSLIWQITLNEWYKNPVFGYGPTIWSSEFRALNHLFAGHSHNQFIEALGQGGISAAAGLLVYIITLAIVANKNRKYDDGLSLNLYFLLLLFMISEVPLRLGTLFDLGSLRQLAIVGYISAAAVARKRIVTGVVVRA